MSFPTGFEHLTLRILFTCTHLTNARFCLPARSRGITDDKLVEIGGSKPNLKIMGATQPEALAKYSDADKILTF